MGPEATSAAVPDASAAVGAGGGAVSARGGGGDVAAAGAAGALAAGAAGAAPVSEPAEPQGPRCLDCGAPVLGPYCQRCGQRHGPPVQTVGTMLAEALADLGGVDGRIFRTLRALLLRPGFLTDEYVAGRQARYLPPFRLYLLCSALYFAVFFATHSSRFFFIWISGDEPDLVTFVRRLPQLMFVLLPVFALMLGVLYRGRRRLYGAHVVFALHFHAFAFLVLPITAAVQPSVEHMVLDGSVGGWGLLLLGLSAAAELCVVVYLYLALRQSYRGGRVVTALKAVVLMVWHVAFLATVSLLTVPSLRQEVVRSLLEGS